MDTTKNTMTKYTYNSVDQRVFPYKNTVRFTRGTFAGWTPRMELANVPHAIFRNKITELLIPVSDLTKENRLHRQLQPLPKYSPPLFFQVRTPATNH